MFAEQFIPLVFQRLLSFSLYACYNPQQTSSSSSSLAEKISFNANKVNDLASINFVPFGEKCFLLVTSLYDEFANQESVIDNQIFKQIIQVSFKGEAIEEINKT